MRKQHAYHDSHIHVQLSLQGISSARPTNLLLQRKIMSTAELVAAANEKFGEGDYEAALAEYDAALATAESNDEIALINANRGACCERLGRQDDAIEAYDAAIEANPDQVEAYHNKAVAFKGQQLYDDAITCFEQALDRDPEFLQSIRGKSETLALVDRFEEALELADQAIALAPEDAACYSDRAFVHMRAKNYAAAIEDYEGAFGLGAEDAGTVNLYDKAIAARANELEQSGDVDGAVAIFDTVLESAPDATRHFKRAVILMRAQRFTEAIEGYASAVEYDPAHFNAQVALGTLCLQNEDFERAATALDAASEVFTDQDDDTKVEVYYNLGTKLHPRAPYNCLHYNSVLASVQMC